MRAFLTMSIFALSMAAANDAAAHCQIPCGIYGDEARFTALMEDVTTLKKSVTKIDEESAAEAPNQNQLVRWVVNKEDHADHISQVMLEYFLAQRIKASQEDYEARLVAVHKIIVLAMKTKQTSDAAVVDELEGAVGAFQELYTGHVH